MNQDVVVSIVTHAMEVGLKVALPILLVGLVVVIIVAGPWMLGQILTWTTELYGSIPSLVGT